MTGRLVGGTALVTAIAAACVAIALRMPLLPPVGEAAATDALAYARARLGHASPPALPAEVECAVQRDLPVIVSLFDRGAPVTRGIGHGATFGAALRAAVAALHDVEPEVLARGRLKLDRVIGEARLSSTIAPLLALGTVPARDGLGASEQGHAVWFTVDDLLRAHAWGAYTPLPETSIGLAPARTLRMLKSALGHTPSLIFRFRAEEFVEPARPGPALPVRCGRTPGPEPTRAAMLDAAEEGGRYLLAHLDEAGQFDYEYYTVEDESIRGAEYSLPRHAGSVSFLAALYAWAPDAASKLAMERALDYLVRQRPRGCDGTRICVGGLDDVSVELGSTALALVAAMEYTRVTSDHRYDAFVRGLTAFVLSMQKDSGELCHLFHIETQRRDEKTQLLYYSGEAAYGLALVLAGNAAVAVPDVAAALDRLLTYLTRTQYDHLAGQFYFGEEHWTCMAIDAGWSFLSAAHKEGYGRFCDAYGQFTRRTQLQPDEDLVRAQPQLAGAYGISAAITPHNTPVGSRTESVASVWRIAKKRGLEDTDERVAGPRAQALLSVRYLLAHQIRDDGAYLMTRPDAARGGFLMSDTDRHVRIDFIQHAASAILRCLELL